MKTLTVHTDGGARGNPGPAGIGVQVLGDSDTVVSEVSEYIGEATNNEAEYTAVQRAFEHLVETLDDTKAYTINVRLDSQLVERQLKGEYKIKEERLQQFVDAIKELERHFNTVTYTHVPRSENKEADRLVNEAVDAAS